MKNLKKTSFLFFSKHWPVLLLVTLVGVFFWKFFLKGLLPIPTDLMTGAYFPWLDYKWGYPTGVIVKNPITSDVFSFIYPMQSFAAESLKAGQWGLWNPYILGGSSLLGNFQSAPFSPTILLYLFFKNSLAWSLQIILQHVFAGVFTYMLLRRWQIAKVASIVGGVIYSFSGFIMIWSQWNGHSLAAAFLPLILYFFDNFLQSRNPRDGVLFSVSLGLQIISGYPQLVFYTFGALALLYVVRAKRILNIKVIMLLIIFTVLGLGVAALQIFPGYELLTSSQRELENYTYEWAFLPWKKIITFIAPDYFGNHATANYWGPQNYTSNIGYVGIVAFSLALVGLRKKSVIKRFALLLGLFSLMLSFPTPVAVLLWKSGVFGFQAAAAHRALFLFNFSVALLAAIGIQQLWEKQYKFSIRAIVPTFLLLSGFAFYAKDLPQSGIALRNLILPVIIFCLSSGILFLVQKRVFKLLGVFLLGLVLVFELFRFGWKFTPFSPNNLFYPTTPVIDFLKNQQLPFRVVGNEIIPINTRMVYGIESLEGYDAVYPIRSAEFISAVNTGLSGGGHVRYAIVDNLSSRLLDIANVKYILVPKRDIRGNPSPDGFVAPIPSKLTKVIFEDKTSVVFENLDVLPRAFVAYQWERQTEKNKIIARMLDSAFDYKKSIILEQNPGFSPPGTGNYKINYTKIMPNSVALMVETSAPGMLFLSDSWYPGWKVFVNGQESKLYRANYAFRAVEIPKGQSKVLFSYEPSSFKLGLVTTFLSIILLILSYFLGKKVLKRYTEAN